MGTDGRVCVWNLTTGTLEAERRYYKDDLNSHEMEQAKQVPTRIHSIALTRDKQCAVLACDDKRAIVLNPDNLECIAEYEHPESVCCAVFSHDAQSILTGSQRGRAFLFTNNDTRIFTHSAIFAISAVAFFRNDGVLITIGGDQIIKMWDSRSGELVKMIGDYDPTKLFNSAAFSPDCSYALMGFIRHPALFLHVSSLHW